MARTCPARTPCSLPKNKPRRHWLVFLPMLAGPAFSCAQRCPLSEVQIRNRNSMSIINTGLRTNRLKPSSLPDDNSTMSMLLSSVENCPTSAPFFGFMGVTAALVFASAYRRSLPLRRARCPIFATKCTPAKMSVHSSMPRLPINRHRRGVRHGQVRRWNILHGRDEAQPRDAQHHPGAHLDAPPALFSFILRHAMWHGLQGDAGKISLCAVQNKLAACLVRKKFRCRPCCA